MDYYRETNSYNDDRPWAALGLVDDNLQHAASDDEPDYDPDYDDEVNKLLDVVEKEILQPRVKDKKIKNGGDHYDPKGEQYEDCYDEFPEDMYHVGDIPSWYKIMLQSKVKETKKRLSSLSNLVCYACASTGAHIKRIEQDHSTTFCKMDPPRHPPLNKPWVNFWKFNCMIKCKEIDKPNHAHTADCESVLLEHAVTGVSTATKNICPNEYPKFVMHAVELFQDFAIETTKSVPYLDSSEAQDTVYEKPVWTEMKLRSNYKNELIIIVRGKGVTSLIGKLKRYFDSGPGRASNVISVFCINQKWSQKKGIFQPAYVAGLFKIRDKVGPITLHYEPKTCVSFNSVEAIQLGKIIEDYAGLTKDTTLLDIGCNFGVLSLMMSHRCDRVIGLNTIHFINSEIREAEEIKKYNFIHNVSFMGCDPKDVFTKCSPLIKRNLTVAILNLASSYGKSVHVMQALRDIPAIWRVIVYGTFTKEFHRNISLLTSKDDQMGEHYLPMQGCILDKSPSVENAFDIIILFERKSLMTPPIELLAPGPTLNVKDDSDSTYSYGSLEDQDVLHPTLKLEKGFGKPDFRSKKFAGAKPFIKYKSALSKYGKFDSPMLPMEKEQTPENSQKQSRERSPPPADTERKFDCSILRQKSAAVPPAAQNGRDKGPYPSIRKELQVKELKRKYDSPSLPIPKEERVVANRTVSPPSTEKPAFDCSVLRKEKPAFDCSLLRKDQEKLRSLHRDERVPIRDPRLLVKKEFQSRCPTPPRDPRLLVKKEYQSSCPAPPRDPRLLVKEEFQSSCPTPPRDPRLLVKKEFQSSCPTPPRERYPSPPPPPPPSRTAAERSFLDVSQIKREKDDDRPCLANVKAEPIDLCEDKEEGELSPEDDGIPRPPDRPKALDPSYFVGFSETNCANVPLPVTVKTEPGPPVRVKSEPEDTQISTDLPDIQSMETPIHRPIALSGKAYVSPHAKAANCTTGDGFEFFVRANQSYLPFKDDAEQPTVNVKTEPQEDPRADEEIEIISEKTSVAQPTSAEPRIRVKSLDEIIKTKSEPESSDDLRTLIEQRKNLQRKLDRDREIRCYKDLHGRSPSPDLPRRYKRQLSPSPPPPFKKYNRSPSPPPRKYNRSPSPPPRKYNRSPSPPHRKYNRSPSPYRRRSPVDRRYKRSPPSPSRPWTKRERSPSPSSRYYTKRDRSPSPPPRWIKRERSPVSPSRAWAKREKSPKRYRRSPSPGEKRYRRSPSPIRFKRESHSPVRFKRDPHSPVNNRWGERSRRSPSTSSSSHSKSSIKWETRKRSKSPVKRTIDKRKRKSRSRSRSPVQAKRRCESLSPISNSPSPSPKKRDGSKERKKKEEKKVEKKKEEKKEKKKKEEKKEKKKEEKKEEKKKEEKKEEKKKKKTKSRSKSKSPSRVSNKKSKAMTDDSKFDSISSASTVPSSPENSDKVDTPNPEAANTVNVPSEQTEPVKQEPASKPRSRTPSPVVTEAATENVPSEQTEPVKQGPTSKPKSRSPSPVVTEDAVKTLDAVKTEEAVNTEDAVKTEVAAE